MGQELFRHGEMEIQDDSPVGAPPVNLSLTSELIGRKLLEMHSCPYDYIVELKRNQKQNLVRSKIWWIPVPAL